MKLIFPIAVAVGAALFMRSLPDIARYLKIREM